MPLIKQSLRERVENFFRFNWHIYTFFLVFAIFSVWFTYTSLSEKYDRLENLVVKNITYVTVATADGRFMKLKKDPIDFRGDIFKRYIANLASQYIYDASIVTDGFQKKPTKALDIYNNSERVKYAIGNFYDNKRNAGAILAVYFKRYTEDELPETIQILGYKIKEYTTMPPDEESQLPEHTISTFDMKIEFKLYTNSWLAEKNKSEERIQHIAMEIKGYANPYKYSSVENPYGIRLHILGDLPTKRSDDSMVGKR